MTPFELSWVLYLAGHGHLGLAGGLGSLLPLPLLLVSLLGVAVEQQVGQDLTLKYEKIIQLNLLLVFRIL